MNYTTQRTVELSGVYRYSLTRQWGHNGKTFVVIGLNPSIADDKRDDATIRVLMYWGKRNDFSRLVMLNLYAYIATDPAELFLAGVGGHCNPGKDIIGPYNTCQNICERIHKEIRIDIDIERIEHIPVVFAAWGNHGITRGRELIQYARAMDFAPIALNLRCFNVTKTGAPRHPLRQKLTSLPYLWPPNEK